MAETALSIDLAFAGGAALIGGVLARLLRQSVLLGYLVAGIAIGPSTPGPAGDVVAIERLADIGVVFLMFGIGVHFSLRQLAAARPAALGVAIQIPLAAAVGAAVARMVGWTWQEAAVFGAVVSVSGGTVLTKLLSERGEEETQHGRLAIAWSICQDIATVVLVVLVGVIGAEAGTLLPELGWALAKAVLFIGVLLLVGVRVIPWLLAAVARLGSRELFILAVAALSLGVALAAEQVGLSLALGAFLAGVVVSESDLSHHALGEVLPLREIFAALFFVSVGMLVDPALVWEELPLFLVLVLAVLSKALIITLVALALRYPVRTAVLAGVGLAPSAEFSFILARQGVSEGVVSPTVFSLMLASTVASIALASPLYRLAPALERSLRRLSRTEPREAPMPEVPQLRNHVVICGAGRVGVLVAGVLRRRGLRYLIIEMDRRVCERLRAAGEPVLYGNAASQPVLARAQLEHARTLVVTIPDPVVTRVLVDQARERNPRLDIVARAMSPDDASDLRERGVAEAVVAERELALEIARHTLHRVGLSTQETQAIVQRLRAEGRAPDEREGG